METKIIKIIVILFTIIFTKSIYSQNYDPCLGFHCEENLETHLISGDSPSSSGGAFKPERTNSYSGTSSSSIFKILIVFVEYDNDTIDVNNVNWAAGNAPVYMNNLLASSRNNSYGSAWWDAYSETNAALSDFWMEDSRGNFHVVGEAHHIVLSHPWYWYSANGNLETVNSEIYDSLDSKLGLSWNDFDNWTFKDGVFKNEPDGQIDMIYVVHRTFRDIGVTPGSIANLYNSNQGYRHVTVSGDTIVAGFGHNGSGCTFTPGAPGGGIVPPFSGSLFLTLQTHEFGHYHFGTCHASYGIMAGGDCYFFTGLDSRHSPWETVKLGYGTPIIQNASITNYSLHDFSSRNGSDTSDTMEVIQVPVSGADEFFLIASRSQVSSYDRIMAGDTAHDNPFRDINDEYGKGLYIYHTPSGYSWYPQMDLECADGLFNWTQDGTRHPDWSNTQNIPYYLKTSVSYSNDQSTGSLSNSDEKSNGTWFAIGKKHVNLGEDGTDRIYTNDQDVWTSRSWKGDRYDAWNLGYNEVFSPYSSPSSNTWNNSSSGIYVWYNSYSGSGPTNSAYIKIYKTSGNLSNDSILKMTPPSRPMGLYVLPCDSSPTINSLKRIKLSWNHNMEPDMKRTVTGETDYFKRYKIYRSTASDMDHVPPDALQYPETVYELIATVELNENSAPFFIDSGLVSTCNDVLCGATSCWEMYPVRYRVQAVDVYNDVSVLSDFVNTEAWDTGEGEGGYYGDNISVNEIEINEGIPTEYSLYQNYPNPFNPVTKIKYDLPFDGNVTIKIFDISGRLMMTAVNETKKSGRYEFEFSGVNLSSGIYYYRIESGNFTQVRKMILLK